MSARPEKARRACAFCKRRKIRCSGDRPSCKRCLELGYKCVYVPYERRTSVLVSHYEEMKNEITRLRAEVDRLKQDVAISPVSSVGSGHSIGPVGLGSSPIVPSSVPLAISRHRGSSSSFKSGSSDAIVHRLAEMHSHHRNLSRHGASIMLGSDELKAQINKCGNVVYQMMQSLSLEEAFDLIDECYFFLNDIYFPYEVGRMKKELRRVYKPVTCFTNFLMQDESYFKPLVLIVLALGKRYKGASRDDTNIIVRYALLLVNPITRLKFKKDGVLLVAIYTVVSLFCRSVSSEDDAMLYSNCAMLYAAHLRLNEDVLGVDGDPEEELKDRIMWVSFGINRTLSAKMGDLSVLKYSDVTRRLPTLVGASDPADKCPDATDFKSYIALTCVAEEICKVVYSNETNNLTEALGNIIQHLVQWNCSLPPHFKFDKLFSKRDKLYKRLVSSVHLNYCYCIHLTTIPVLYSLVEKSRAGQPVNINDNLQQLITICINAAEMTVNILMSCQKENTLATFGVMDLDYVHSAALSFFMCGDVLEIQPAQSHRLLSLCLFLMQEIAKSGNLNAQTKFEGMQDLIDTYRKSREESRPAQPSPKYVALDESMFIPDPAMMLDTSAMDTFQGLSEADLDIWTDGYRNLQQVEAYWDEFQKNL